MKIDKEQEYIIDIILELISKNFDIKKRDIFSKTRKSEVIIPRQIAHYLIKKHTKINLVSIGNIGELYEIKGGYGHATILNSIKSVNNLIYSNNRIKLIIEKIDFKILDIINKIPKEDILKINEHKDKILMLEKMLHEKNLIILNLENNINDITNNKDLMELLKCNTDIIDEFCQTRVRPFLNMIKSRKTNKDLIKFQYETRSL